MPTTLTAEPFGCLDNGQPVTLYTLEGERLRAQVMDLGATLVSLRAPDRDGRAGDVVLGFDSVDGYVQPAQPYLGAVVGRCANRIAQGRFTLDGQAFQLARNNLGQHLHGGLRGFDKLPWQAAVRPGTGGNGGAALVLTLVSPDGDEGYPGRLEAQVRYTLDGDALRLDYSAQCDRPTVVNLTNHAYFNLAGGGDVLGHELRIAAQRFTPVSEVLIPSGELREVAGTPMDFREFRRIGERLDADDEQLRHAGGYDHNWVLDGPVDTLRPVAWLREPASGRTLEVLTTQPGLQFYSGNFLDGSLVGRDGQRYGHRHGLCLETQHFPDSPNQPTFPSVRLEPGQAYRQTTVYRFGTGHGD